MFAVETKVLFLLKKLIRMTVSDSFSFSGGKADDSGIHLHYTERP
jgi:hypothetical protein